MAFTAAEKKEMEVLMRKEIKDFLSSNTSKQFEDKLMDKISKELQRGGLRKDIKNIVIKSFQEYFTVMYQQRGFWEQKFRNA
jgi:Rod binding domain-containing protein